MMVMYAIWETELTEKRHYKTFLCMCMCKYSLSCTLKCNAIYLVFACLLCFIKMFLKEKV